MSAPLFIPLSRFKEFGLPGRSKAYDDDKHGLLELRKLGKCTGVTMEEAQRYVAANARPMRDAKRDTKRATAASLTARGARQ